MLVLRGNVGFPDGRVGRVRLRMARDGGARLVEVTALRRAVGACLDELLRSLDWLDRDMEGELQPAVSARLILVDQRLRDGVVDRASRAGVVRGLRDVARSYALTAMRMETAGDAGSEWLAQRAAEVEDLCLVIAASLRRRWLPKQGAVLLLAEPPGTFLALAAIHRRASAIVIEDGDAGDGAGAHGIDLLRRAGVPVVDGVRELFAWVRPGDRLLVDADAATVLIEPSSREVLRTRSCLAPGR